MANLNRSVPRVLALALGLLRLALYCALVAGVYFGFQYVNQRSKAEVDAVKNRQESEYYLIVDEPVRMTVVDDQGNMSMEISGDSVRLTTDQRTAIFSGAKATYYEDGEWSIKMNAGEIEYDTQSEDFLLTAGLGIETKDGMVVQAPVVEWRRGKDADGTPQGNKAPSFRFPDGVAVTSSDGNTLVAKYMQADKELLYMELVGDVRGAVREFKDTEFISERNLTSVEDLKLEDFETLAFHAEQVIYDKRNQVILATSRFYDRSFTIRDMDGRIVRPEDYEPEVLPVTFSKEEITIQANHLEAHIEKQWVECLGNIEMVIPPATPEPGDDRSLQAVKQHETRIATEDVEYFWGRDYILTHGPTRVEQEDRLARANQIVYWGDARQVLLDGDVTLVQGDGQWLMDEQLVSVEDHDMRRAVTAYSELSADRATVYLNNNDFVASGSVLVRQHEREVSADTIVYQDDIKRITADGGVKFWDKDDQAFVCNSLIFHNDSDFMEVYGGMSATLRIPAKYANDINRTLADMREVAAPAAIEDPQVVDQPARINPNRDTVLAMGLQPLETPGPPPIGPLAIPGTPAGGQPEELIIDLGDGLPVEPAPEPENEGGEA